MKPIYEPKGAAKEYGDLAINIYTGCPHMCRYCFAPSVLRKDKETFHDTVIPRDGIVDAVQSQIKREKITDKLIHLCFVCDPYPIGCDSTATREIIKIIKESGNHVQILTKGDGSRDFDLLDSQDKYGVTISTGSDLISREWEPNAVPTSARIVTVGRAKNRGIGTWVSMEPVITEDALTVLELFPDLFDFVKIGKLNYFPSDINWKHFGEKAESVCKDLEINYYIKDSLRKEMEK